MDTSTTYPSSSTPFNSPEYGDETRLFKLLEQDGAGFIIDICILSIVVLVVVLCIWKRPKTLCFVIVCWIVWLVYAICEIRSRELPFETVWQEIKNTEHTVQTSTKSVIVDIWKFLISWVALVVPITIVLGQAIGKAWERTPHQHRPIFFLAGIGLIGVFLLVRSIVRNRKSIASAAVTITFHLSFIVVGPLVYWLISKTSLDVTPWIVYAFMTVFPTLWSVFVLNCFKAEIRDRERLERSDLREVTSLMRSGIQPQEEDLRIIRILRTMFQLLSYWSCWPFFHVADEVMAKEGVVTDKNAKSTAYGVILALVFWFQYWGASRIAPVVCRYTSKCCKSTKRMVVRCCKKEKDDVDEDREGEAEMQAQKSTKEKIIEATRSLPMGSRCADFIEKHYYKLVILLICVAGLLIFMSFFLSSFGIVVSLASLAFLFVVGFDSASRVEWTDTQMAPSRIGFWITAMVWLLLCRIAVLSSILTRFTLIVFIFAFLFGQMAAHIVSGCVRLCCSTCCDAIGRKMWSKEKAGDDEFDEDEKDESAEVELSDVRHRSDEPPAFDDASKQPLPSKDSKGGESW